MTAPEMRSPAPTVASGKDRAERSIDNKHTTTTENETEAMATRYVARRLRVPFAFARVVVTLAGLGGRLA